MKLRLGFVSNSSDASFAIPLDRLTQWQIEAIKRHSALGEMLGIAWADDEWSISVTDRFIVGDTGMDNFDMDAFFEAIGIPDNAIFRDSAKRALSRDGNWNHGIMPSDWNESAFSDIASVRFDAAAHSQSGMTDKEFFANWLKDKDFKFLEELAKKSEMAKRLLADPDFKVGSDES